MSVSRDGFSGIEDRDFAYTDVEYQAMNNNLSVAAGSLDGSTNETGGQDEVWEATVGGREALQGELHRGEVAELLALNVDIVVYTSSTQTADGTVRGAIEISREGTFQMVDGEQLNTAAGSFNGINMQVISPGMTIEEDVLAFLSATGHSAFSDGASGVGGGGSAGEASYSRSYLDDFGSGPLFDPEDEFYQHAQMTQWNVADAAFHIDWNFEFWWVVHEVADIEDQIYHSPTR